MRINYLSLKFTVIVYLSSDVIDFGFLMPGNIAKTTDFSRKAR